MYQPLLLQFINFMAHEDSMIEDFSGTTMIYGVNNTDEGQMSNGSGKSAIEEAIALTLTGKPLRKVSAKDLVRLGEKFANIDFVFGDEKEIIRIRRIIYSNTKSAELMIKVNDETPTDLIVNADDKVDVVDGNKWILKKIGVSREDLLNFFIVSKEKYKSFLTSSDGDKKSIIDRFSNSLLVDPVFDVLSKKEDEIKLKIRSLEDSVVGNNSKIELLKQQQLEDTKEIFLQKKKVSLERIERDIEFDKNQSIEFDKRLLIKDEALTGFEEDLKKIPDLTKMNIDLKAIDEKIASQLESHSIIQSNLTEMIEMSAKLKTSIAGSITCPNCKYEFVLGQDVDIKSTKDHILECGKILTDLEKEIEDSRSAGSVNRVKQKELAAKISKINISKREISNSIEKTQSEIKKLFERKDEAVLSIEENEIRLKELKDKPYKKDDLLEVKVNELTVAISKSEESIENEKNNLIKILEQTNYMKKFKAHLANKAIRAIEVMANNYLQLMKTNLSLNIEGFKINKNKKIVEKITCHVLRDGIPEGLFEKFSTGEKSRIESAMIMALQKLINKNTKGLDLCFLDEILDGLDPEGMRGVLKMFKELDQNIMIVTHGVVDQQVDKYITVVKELGISKIVA